MNKITYFLLLLCCMIVGGVEKAYAGIGDKLEKSGWKISASSWCWDDRKDGNGKYDRIIDGDIQTYWHSNWNSSAGGEGEGGSLPEWFIVDLGSSQEIGGVIYTPRQQINQNTNGACKTYKVYVSNSPFAVTDKTSVTNLTGEVATGNFEYTVAPKSVIFKEKQNAQYVMFVITDSHGAVTGKWATCAEFDVCKFADVANVTYTYSLQGTQTTKTKTVEQAVGSAYQAPALDVDFVTFTQPEGTVQAGENKVDVQCTENLPFEKTTDLQTPKWYAIDMHSNQARYMWHYGADNQNISVAVPNDLVSISKDDAYFWCITGNVFDGFQIYNKQAKTQKSLNTTTGKPQITEGEHTTWYIVKPKSSISNAVCFKAKNTQYLNHQADNTLGYWQDPDEGSSCRFFKPAAVVMESAEVLANIPDNAVGGYLNGESLDPAITAVEKDRFSFENANKLVDAIKALKSNGVSIEDGKYYRFKKANQNFYIGAKDAQTPFCKDGANAKQLIDFVWQAEAADNGGFYLKNLNVNAYLGQAVDAPNKMLLAAEKSNAGVYTFTDKHFAKYEIVNDNKALQREEGGNTANCLNYWSGASADRKEWYLIEATDVEVALNTAGDASYATTYLPFAVSSVQGATAYIGKVEKQTNGDVLRATAIENGIPANTGVILKGAANEAKAVLTLGVATSNVEGNALLGTLVEKDYVTGDLVFGKSAEGVVGFYSMASGKKIGANKAYLAAAAAQAMKLVFDGDVTGIENVMGEAADADAPIYDLTGRRVMKTVKGGLYIQNGKKFIAQ